MNSYLKPLLAVAAGVLIAVVGFSLLPRELGVGVPKIQFVDFDTVEPTNVTTQGYLVDDVGRAKVNATADLCQQIEPMLDVEEIKDRFRPTMEIGMAVFCCVDSITARAAIWRV